jgi:hypothetical protein
MKISMSRQNTISRVLGTLLPSFLITVSVSGQTAEREKLTEPTYRVSKSTDLGPMKSVAPPVESSSTHAPTGRQPELDDAGLKTGNVQPPTPSLTPDPAFHVPSEAEQVFAEAMDDAASILDYIQRHVEDYTCIFVKREEVKGKVIGPQYIYTKVRNRKMNGDRIVVPFAVYMKFIKPNELKGREALYIEDENNGKILAKDGGLKGKMLPPVYLLPNSRFVMADNRYPITEFGIETLTKRLLERGHADRNIADCIVSYTDGATVCGRPCRYLEVRRPKPKVGKDAQYGMNVPLARVFIDSELNVPMRYVAYDWPKQGKQPQVLEEYTYQNLKLNVGLTDADFNRDNPEYGF